MSSFDQQMNRRRLAMIGVAATASIAGTGALNSRALAQAATAEAEGGPGLPPLPDGKLLVAVNSIISAPDAPAGQVIRIDGIAA